MVTRRILMSGILVLAALSGTHASEPEAPARTLESVEKELLEKWEKVRSYTTKLTAESREKKPSRKSHAQSTGTIQYLRDGERWYMRTETTMNSTVTTRRGKDVRESRSVNLTDGQHSYVILDNEPPLVLKMDIDPAMAGSVAANFAAMRLNGKPQLREDEVVDGRPAYVVDVRFQAVGNPPWKVTYCFDKETGILVKTVTADDAGTQYGWTVQSDLKINPDLKPDQFVFEAPEGAVIQDQTKAAAEAAAREAEKKAAESTTPTESQLVPAPSPEAPAPEDPGK